MRLLYITRKFPPMVGGMENMSSALAQEFSRNVDTTLLTWGKSQKYLPFVLPLFFLKALYLIPAKRIDHIHIGDGLLSPLGLFLKKIYGIKTTISIAGLDITYKLPIYQKIIPRCVAQLDKIICISEATENECLIRNIPKEKCLVLPCGVYEQKNIKPATKNDLEKLIGAKIGNKKIILTVGRLVERKGVFWFVDQVMPSLGNDIIYLIVGEGPDKPKIEQVIRDKNLSSKVILLGRVPDKKLKTIYQTANLFVMPNINKKGDIEGFGIVAIEASIFGLPVIGSKTEGIMTAIHDKKNGFLVEPSDKKEWINSVKSVISSNKKYQNFKEYTLQNFDWKIIGKNYIQAFSN